MFFYVKIHNRQNYFKFSLIGILAYSLIGASMVFKQREAFGQNWNLVKCLALLEISALVFSMSLCNFSLAYLITLIYVPVGKFKHNLKKYISV